MEFYNNYDTLNDQTIFEYYDKHYLRGYSWNLNENPNTLTRDEKKPTKKELDKVHVTEFTNVYLLIPLTRFYEIMEVLPIGNKLTLRNVVNALYEFYKKPMTKEQIEKISLMKCDTNNYITKLVKEAEEGKEVCYGQLRGCSVWFEGIKRIEGNLYKLCLGS
jgi:hypothetical protein